MQDFNSATPYTVDLNSERIHELFTAEEEVKQCCRGAVRYCLESCTYSPDCCPEQRCGVHVSLNIARKHGWLEKLIEEYELGLDV